jgi:branched-chain amino acid transport system ATP-binding protein
VRKAYLGEAMVPGDGASAARRDIPADAPEVLGVGALVTGYGASPVLHGRSTCACGAARLVALLGSNGAGKTTTLNCISNLVDCTEGEGRHRRRSASTGSGSDALVKRGIVQVPEGRQVFPRA